VAELLEVTRPVFDRLAESAAGKRVTIVAGNHDHALVEPWLTRRRLSAGPLDAENEWPVEAGERDGPAGWIASRLSGAEVTIAYPGLRLRPDLYVTHGHYLDLHLTIPRLESIAASAMGRLTKLGKAADSAADYETILGPMYAFYGGLAQGATAAALARGGSFSRTVWQRASDGRAPDSGSADPAVAAPAPRERAAAAATRFLLGRVTIPGAVAALNVLGLGPFRATLTGEELRRSGLMAMAQVADALAPGAEHLLFGHTHRPGPLPGDDPAEWATPSGTRLWNSGSWLHEGAFVRTGRDSPYWPGTVIELVDEDAPRVINVLD
jgi:hypothetical protein